MNLNSKKIQALFSLVSTNISLKTNIKSSTFNNLVAELLSYESSLNSLSEKDFNDLLLKIQKVILFYNDVQLMMMNQELNDDRIKSEFFSWITFTAMNRYLAYHFNGQNSIQDNKNAKNPYIYDMH